VNKIQDSGGRHFAILDFIKVTFLRCGWADSHQIC